MDASQGSNPLHKVLKQIVCSCLDQNLLEEAESLLNFLDLIGIEPRTVRLVRMWSRCLRGDMQGALRLCVELSEQDGEMENIEAVLALLRYVVGDRTWRTLCDRILDSPTSTDESKKLARALLDGTFGKKGPEDEKQSVEEVPAASAPKNDFDFAIHSSFMRA